jgi:hypothetical protein
MRHRNPETHLMLASISTVVDRFRMPPPMPVKAWVDTITAELAELATMVDQAHNRYVAACVRLSDADPDASAELDAAEAERDRLDRRADRLQTALREAEARAQRVAADDAQTAEAARWKQVSYLVEVQDQHLQKIARTIDLLGRQVLQALEARERLTAAIPRTGRFDPDGPLMTRPLLEAAIKLEISRVMPWPPSTPWGRQSIPKLSETATASAAMIRGWEPSR